MITKALILFLMALSSILNHAQDAWGAEVFLNIKEMPLRNVLSEIRNQSNLNLIYDVNQVNTKVLTCNIKSSAENVITEVLSKNGFAYKKYNDNTAVIFKDMSAPKKNKAVVRKTNLEDTLSQSQLEFLKPTLLSKLELTYPQAAIRDRLEGEVLAKILVTSKGNVSDVILQKSSGHKILDTATINYVNKLEFLPAEFNGKYRSVWTTMLVKYNFE